MRCSELIRCGGETLRCRLQYRRGSLVFFEPFEVYADARLYLGESEMFCAEIAMLYYDKLAFRQWQNLSAKAVAKDSLSESGWNSIGTLGR